MLIPTCGSVLTGKKFLVRHCKSVAHGDGHDGQQVEAEEEDASSIDLRSTTRLPPPTRCDSQYNFFGQVFKHHTPLGVKSDDESWSSWTHDSGVKTQDSRSLPEAGDSAKRSSPFFSDFKVQSFS